MEERSLRKVENSSEPADNEHINCIAVYRGQTMQTETYIWWFGQRTDLEDLGSGERQEYFVAIICSL